MNDSEIFVKNRAILSHFDSYSTALVFARFGNTLLAPGALPEGATVSGAPADVGDIYAGDAVVEAAMVRYGLSAAEVSRDSQYDAWVQAEGVPIRIHLLRFRTFRAPDDRIQPRGGSFVPISALRGAAPVELGLIRSVFNLIMGGDPSRG